MAIAVDRDTLLHRGVAEIIREEELSQLLDSGRPLRLKMGFDPTARDVTLGWAVGLRKLRQFQELGHQVILIVGDWTAQIGDPAGQSATRRMLTAEEVRFNAEHYLRQFFKIVDPARTQVAWQSEWFGPPSSGSGRGFTLADVIALTSKFTVAKLLSREDFALRYREGRPITLAELVYPLLQAYDSVAIQADVEFGGTDQKFNCLAGRDLQDYLGQRPQQLFLVPLLPGTDGRKMSQSYGNYIGVEEPPDEMYGKIMSITDAALGDYLELLTEIPMAEVEELKRAMAAGQLNPMAVKMRLAREIVAQFHDLEAARLAEAHFTRVVRQGQTPEEVPTVTLKKATPTGRASQIGNRPWIRRMRLTLSNGKKLEADENTVNNYRCELADLIVALELVSSNTEAKRLIDQGAIEFDDQTVYSRWVDVTGEHMIRVGKRRFVRLVKAEGSSPSP